jgi:type IV secretory pathway component VirB8
MSATKANKNFLDHGQDWFYDRYLAREVEAKRYLIISILLAVLLAVTVIGWVIILPLKRTVMEPYVVLVDNITGITASLTAAKANDLTEQAPVVRYFLAKYAQAREGYSAATIDAQIDLVRALSTPEVFLAYQAEWNDSMHKEQRASLGPQGEISTEILSVTFPLPNIAHVRYIVDEKRAGVTVAQSTWLATLKMDQVQEIDDSLAALNPLGLVIVNYETVRESNHALHN